MKNLKIFAFLSMVCVATLASNQVSAQAVNADEQTSLQAQVPDTVHAVADNVYTVEPYVGNPTISDVISASKAETFVDSLRAVANVLTDDQFKSLLLQTIKQLNDKPAADDPTGWLNWASALFAALGAFVSFLVLRFGGMFKSFHLSLLLLLMCSTALQSCASCQFTSNYNYVDDKVLGCVECKNVKENLQKVGSNFGIKILKIK
jgi:hypothetical protein